jgi:serine/threonine protein kinase
MWLRWPPFGRVSWPPFRRFFPPGTVIGRYKLLEKIGEGGMAVVYMAEQTEPIRRKAALKIIKLGMDTRQVIVRFEAERQALALMDHPSIAKVLDAGATETGRPYFVMELVQGVSITEYCDKKQPLHQAPARPLPPGLPRRAARPPKRRHPPGYQTFECHGYAP